jgi:hypothetical protein
VTLGRLWLVPFVSACDGDERLFSLLVLLGGASDGFLQPLLVLGPPRPARAPASHVGARGRKLRGSAPAPGVAAGG